MWTLYSLWSGPGVTFIPLVLQALFLLVLQLVQSHLDTLYSSKTLWSCFTLRPMGPCTVESAPAGPVLTLGPVSLEDLVAQVHLMALISSISHHPLVPVVLLLLGSAGPGTVESAPAVQ